MFYYFGGKRRSARSYGPPAYPLVIEPFAGGMGYSMIWKPPLALGIEADPQVVELWHRITAMSVDEIASFPAPEVGSRSSDRWVIAAASSNGNNTVTSRKVNAFLATRFEDQRNMALRCHDYARSNVWYRHGDYRSAPDVEATWFIDPPYASIKKGYTHDPIDYEELAEWCLARKGQTIICEGRAGAWLPFKHHHGNGLPTWGAHASTVTEKVFTQRTHHHCEVCGTTFPVLRAHARYCSPRCRKRAQRARV